MIQHSPILAVAVLLFGGFLTPLIDRIAKWRKNELLRDFFVLGIVIVSLLFVLDMAPTALNGGVIVYQLAGRAPPWGINLIVDGLAIQMALMIGILGTTVVAYSLIYMRGDSGLGKYYTLLLVALAGMLGVVLTGDLFNFYVFLEIMSTSSYALIAFRRGSGSLEASIKYLFIGTLGTTFILLSIALLYGLVGSLNIADIGVRLGAIQASSQSMPLIIVVALGLFVTGIMIKTAMVPFHPWLIDGLTAAPTAVSALIAGPEAVVGIYWIARVPYLPFGTPIGIILIAFGLTSMTVGVLLALVQPYFKRMLAYHVVSQKGYMVLGLGLGTVLGVKGGLFHLLNHSTYKALLFMCAGAVVYRTKTQKFDELGGLLNRMPWTAMLFLIGAFAISGMPPLNGFWSKFTIYLAGIGANMPIVTIIAMIVSVLTLASFTRAFIKTFMGSSFKDRRRVKEVPVRMLIPMFVLAAICIGIGLLPALGYNVVGPAQSSVMNPGKYIAKVLGG